MIGSYAKITSAIHVVLEMPDGQVDGQQLPIECTVLAFRMSQLTAEESQLTGLSIDDLLKYASNGNVAGICSQNEGASGTGNESVTAFMSLLLL